MALRTASTDLRKEKNPSRLVYGVAASRSGSVELELIFEVDGAPVRNLTSYRTMRIDGLSISYREAGPKDGPTLLPPPRAALFSSRMFERSSPAFRSLSPGPPDYPGFGTATGRTRRHLAYTFDHYAEIMNHFAEAVGSRATRCTCRITAAPWGFAWRSPSERIEALIVQDRWRTTKPGGELESAAGLWPIASPTKRAAHNLLSLATTRTRHVGSDPEVEGMTRISGPMSCLSQPARPGRHPERPLLRLTAETSMPTQMAGWMREQQPRLLILWENTTCPFELSEPEPIARRAEG